MPTCAMPVKAAGFPGGISFGALINLARVFSGFSVSLFNSASESLAL